MIFNKTAYFVLKATFSSKNNKNQQKHQKNKKAANWKAKKRWKDEHCKLNWAADVHGSWKKVKYTCLYLTYTSFLQHMKKYEKRG